MKNTGPAYMTGPNEFVNEALPRSITLKYLCSGKGRKEIIKGGSKIKDGIMFDDGSTATWYLPGQSFSYLQPQVMTETESNWRFLFDYEAWQEEVIDLNVGADMTSNSRAQKYKDEKRKIEQRCFTSLLNKIEGSSGIPDGWLWGNPHGNSASMEAAGGERAYPIATFINEETNTLPNGWTTVQGINPATETKWQNNRHQYNASDLNDTSGAGTGLLDQFEAAVLSSKFDSIPFANLDASDTTTQRRMIYCSALGMRNYKKVMRDNNDQTYKKDDPAFQGVYYGNVPIIHIDALTNAALYNLGGSYTGTETTATTPGARYYFVDADWLVPYFHEAGYYKRMEAFHPSSQPTSWVRPVRMYCNLFCRSRRRLAIVYPGA